MGEVGRFVPTLAEEIAITTPNIVRNILQM